MPQTPANTVDEANRSNNTYYSNRYRTGSSGSAAAYVQNSPSVDEDDSLCDGDHDAEVSFYGHGGGVALAPGELTPTNNNNKGMGQYDLVGSMWKRRFGLGRNADRNWVMRCFTLNGPILCYHEESEIESVADSSKPRALLNLSKVETIAEMHSKQKPGLPTQDLLTINIYDPIVHAKRKWEMCCTSKEQQLLWYKAINYYDGKPVIGSTDKFMGVLEPPVSPNVRNSCPTPDIMTTSIMRMSSRDAPMIDDVELIAKAAAKAAEILMDHQQQQMKNYSNEMMAMIVVGVNMLIYFARNGSEQTYKAIQFVMNAFVLYSAYQNMTSKSASKSQRGPKARAAKSKIITAEREDTPRSPLAKEQQPISNLSSFAKNIPAGTTIPRAPPTKNSELAKQLQIHDRNSAQAIRAYAAAPTNDIEVKAHSYANTDASLFQLRVGPNYKKNKQKAPSAPALYDLLSMDFLYADSPLKNTADKFRIPSIPGITDVSTGHAHIPPIMIINTWLPGEEPSMFQKSTDGETYSIPMVFVLSQDTLRQLKDIETASPGVKLWSEWCRRAENELDFRGRFKCMGMIENIESTGVPKFIQGYNGKPALVTKSGTFTRHENYIEFSINVNMWAFLAKKGLWTLEPTFPDFIFNVGFTIEARKDEEMPEVLLGGCRLMNLDPDKTVVDGVDDVEI